MTVIPLRCPEPAQRALYAALALPEQITRPVRTWVKTPSDEYATSPPQTAPSVRKSG
jgi:hypothetical protein